MFSGKSLLDKTFYFLYDANSRHYNVITNLKAAMAKRYMCNACDTLHNFTNVKKLAPMYSYTTLY